jgi:hypothetical protein
VSNYTKSTNFAAKDSLPSGNAGKVVKGTEINTEFDNIATAIATKADLNSPTLVTPNLGTPSAAVLTNATGLPLTTGVTGTLPVANGGTGATTFSAGALLKGAGTSAITTATAGTDYAPATSGTAILKGNGTGGFSNAAAGTDYAAATTGTSAQLLANNGSGGFSNVTVGSGLSLSAGTLSNTASVSAATPTTLGTVYGSMTTNSSTYLTAAGYNAGAGNTGNFNTAFGTLALDASPSGAANNAFGVSTLGSNTTGASNSGFGHNALASNTTGNYNVAVGHQALDNNDTASNNIAVGYQAMRSNTTANNNTAIGYQALYSNTTAVSNTAVGVQAGYTSNATAAPSNVGANVFVGSSAGYSATSAIHSVMIGAAAGYNVNTGSSNTLVGRLAGYNLTSGTFNTFVGPGDNNGGSGAFVSTGGKNTILGAYNGNQDGLDIRTASNYAVISDGDGNRLLSTANGYSLALDGGAVPQSGTGITFPATQSASSDANTLDDYEEGTWTPTQGAGITLVGSFSSTGTYTKIGNIVTLRGRLSGSTSLAITAASVLCGGLPFTPSGDPYAMGSMTNSAVNTSATVFVVSASRIDTAGTFSATPTLYFSVTYQI